MRDGIERRTVLVVDDDDAIQVALKIVLEDRGWAVIIAEDGRAALDVLGRIIPDVIVLDLMMPRMDGFSFVRQLEQRGIRGRTPIIVLTAAGRARPMVAQMGVDGYLEKPSTIDTLVAEIMRLLPDRQS